MVSLILAFLVQAFAQPPPRQSLEQALQHYLNSAALSSSTGIQLTYKDAHSEINIASGIAGARAATVNDKWLFGSGTKPVTAALVLKRVEEGRVGLNDTVSKHLDTMFKEKVGQSFLHMFGPNATNVTIWHLLTMQAGMPDWDTEVFDQKMLETANTKAWTPLDMVQYAAGQPWLCYPGQCVFYSSTNYVLLGYVLLALEGKDCDDWSTLQQITIAPMVFSNSSFANEGILNRSGLTVPGRASIGRTTIYGQRADILGWTCGNLVTSSRNMARFMWELLVARTILSEPMLKLMTEFRDFSFGFGKSGDIVQLRYGAGLMTQQADYWRMYNTGPWSYGDWGTTMGHGGDTYGFVSDQGYIPQLNATWSWVSNTENVGRDVSYFITCNLIKIATKINLGKLPPQPALHCDYPVLHNELGARTDDRHAAPLVPKAFSAVV